jgi:hypothetical protein
MKIGRNSVKARGSSNCDGLVTGEANSSKQWSLWRKARPGQGQPKPNSSPARLQKPPAAGPAGGPPRVGSAGRAGTPGVGTGGPGTAGTPGGGTGGGPASGAWARMIGPSVAAGAL